MNKKEFEEYIEKLTKNDNVAFQIYMKVATPLIWNWIEQYAKQARIDELNNIAEDCPNCPNQGWYEVTGTYINRHTGEPEPQQEQEQCQFCYEVKNSRFNIENRIKELEK